MSSRDKPVANNSLVRVTRRAQNRRSLLSVCFVAGVHPPHKNELYTSMKQKTMDHELMARLNRERQDAEKRRFEQAKISVKRLESKRKVQKYWNISYDTPNYSRWEALRGSA